MFGAEPRETLSKAAAAEFEEYAAVRLKNALKHMIWAALVAVICVVCVVPFLDGYPFHNHWNGARNLIWVALAAWLWFVYKAALVWASWQSTHETRREFDVSDGE